MGKNTERIPAAVEEIIQILLKQFGLNFNLTCPDAKVSNRPVFNLADWKVSSWKLACASKTDLVILGIVLKRWVRTELTRENFAGNVL